MPTIWNSEERGGQNLGDLKEDSLLTTSGLNNPNKWPLKMKSKAADWVPALIKTYRQTCNKHNLMIF